MVDKPLTAAKKSELLLHPFTLLEKAVHSVGGVAALGNSFVIESTGVRSIYGESFEAGQPPQPVAEFEAKTSIYGENIRVDRHTVIFRGTPSTKKITYSEIIRDKLGYIVGVDNWLVTPTTNIPSGRVASIRKQTLLCNPHLYLAMAQSDPAIVVKNDPRQVVEDGEQYDILKIEDGVSPTVELYIHTSTGQISKLVTLENDHLFRDIPLVVTYHQWTNEKSDSGLLSFPLEITLSGKGEQWYKEYRTKITQNPTFTNEFDFPPEAHPIYEQDQYSWGWFTSQFVQMWCTFGVSKNEQQLRVEPIELADGVYFIRGSMYNSMVVDQGDNVVVVEAPLYPERSEAIMAWVASTLKKPVSHLIVTHHHFDHFGGVRAYVAANVPIMIAEPGVSLLQEVSRRPSTVVPDAQEKAHAKPISIPIGPNDLGVIENGSATVQKDTPVPTGRLEAGRRNVVYALRFATMHANDQILIKIASNADGPTVLFQSDMFNPDDKIGGPLNPIWTVEFRDDVTAAGLNLPNTILCGGHAGYAPLNQLYEFVDQHIPFYIKAYVFFQAHKRAIVIGAVILLMLILLAIFFVLKG